MGLIAGITEVDHLMATLMKDWRKEFRYIHDILNHISFFPSEQSGPFYPGPMISYEQRKKDQIVWYCQYLELTNEERDLIQTYWVPVWVEDSMWFVDSSKPSLPIIGIEQYEEEPFRWFYSFQLYSNLLDLLQDLEQDITRIELQKKYENAWFEADCRELDRIGQMRSDGDLPLEEIFIEEIFVHGLKTFPLVVEDKGIIAFNDVLPLIVYLLPHDLDIELQFVQCDYRTEDYAETFQSITRLSQFIYLLYTHGQEHFPKFHFTIPKYGAEVFHNFNNELKIIGLEDVELRMTLLESLENLNK